MSWPLASGISKSIPIPNLSQTKKPFYRDKYLFSRQFSRYKLLGINFYHKIRKSFWSRYIWFITDDPKWSFPVKAKIATIGHKGSIREIFMLPISNKTEKPLFMFSLICERMQMILELDSPGTEKATKGRDVNITSLNSRHQSWHSYTCFVS